MKKIKTLKLETSSRATLGGTPYDVIANGENIGTIAIIDEDDKAANTIKLLLDKGFEFDPYEVYDLLGMEA